MNPSQTLSAATTVPMFERSKANPICWRFIFCRPSRLLSKTEALAIHTRL
jgi:hypothetical protein